MSSGTVSIPLDIVVARYTEDVSWIDDLKAVHPRVWLYNKGGDLPGRPCMSIDNIGREAHTYLYHIITRWDDLADRTIFCQAGTADHAPAFVDDVLLYGINPKVEPFKPFGRNVRNQGVRLVRDDLNGQPHNGTVLPIESYCERFGIELDSRFVYFAPGACFAVTRKAIKSPPRSFYESLINDITSLPGRSQPWILERIWSNIFNKKVLDKNRTSDTLLADN
jgi:hypothetical protein